jgi:hypothetical protein
MKGALLCVATELHDPELIELFAGAVRDARAASASRK